MNELNMDVWKSVHSYTPYLYTQDIKMKIHKNKN